MDPITRSSTPEQLVPGLYAVVSQMYAGVPEEHKILFEVRTSKRSFEEMVEMGNFGYDSVKPEGDAIRYDNAKELGKARFVPFTTALGYKITREAVDDNLYSELSKVRSQGLGRALGESKQQRAANYFNNGFTATGFGFDGVALFSASHPTSDVGNQSNLLTGDLTETTLETALVSIGRQKDDRGLLTGAIAQKLVIPASAQMFNAHRILKSDLSTTPIQNVAGTENVSNKNDANAVREMGFFPEGVSVCHRLTDDDAWFIKTNQPDGTIMFQRQALMQEDEGDFDTGNFKHKAWERYCFGHGTWRQWYGSQGS